MDNKSVWNFDDEKDKRTIILDWTTTLWCNYKCSYCYFSNHDRKQVYKSGKKLVRIYERLFNKTKSAHCFDNYSAEEWVSKIAEITEGRKAVLNITGGEPFLDKKNFYYVLKSLCEMDSIASIKIDTNATFDPAIYKDINTEKVFLFISFHSEFITLDKLFDKVKILLETGFNVPLIDFVFAPGQRDRYEEVRDKFARIGLTVLPNVYQNIENPEMTKKDAPLYEKYLNELDIKNKCNLIDLKGKVLCRTPQNALTMNPIGEIYNSCFMEKKLNLFKATREQIESLLTDRAALCPLDFCCTSWKYSFQAGCTRNDNSLHILENFARDAVVK